MAHREGAPQDWTPNVLVEQRTHQNANKAQQTGRQIHPPTRDKDGNLQPHSPWMVLCILEDHRDNLKGTEVRIAHALPHTHLNYTVPTSNILLTYGEARKSTYRLLADTEGTAYTIYTWARYGDLPAPIWHPDPSSHPSLHGRHVPRQGIKPLGSSATSTHGNPPPPYSLTPLSQTPGSPSSTRDAPPQMTPPTAERGSPSEWPCTTPSTETKPPGSTRAPSPSGWGGWLNTLNPQKLRRLAGPYILYPVPHGMDDHCPGLQPGDPPCGHPCPHALFEPLPP